MKTNLALGCLNFLLLTFFLFRFGLPFVTSSESVFTNTDSVGVFLAAQANQFALLQVGLAALGILIAIVALWGYNQITVGAAQAAEKKINEVVPELVKKAIDNFSLEEINRRFVEMKMQVPSEKTSLKDVLSDSIEKLDPEPLDGMIHSNNVE